MKLSNLELTRWASEFHRRQKIGQSFEDALKDVKDTLDFSDDDISIDSEVAEQIKQSVLGRASKKDIIVILQQWAQKKYPKKFPQSIFVAILEASKGWLPKKDRHRIEEILRKQERLNHH